MMLRLAAHAMPVAGVWFSLQRQTLGGSVAGAGTLRRIVRFDLPRRLGMLPRPVTEALTAIVITAALVGFRIAVTPVVGDVAPFALALLAMVLATLVAGWRSGLLSITLGIATVWYFVLEPRH